jgi:hypothetical protein
MQTLWNLTLRLFFLFVSFFALSLQPNSGAKSVGVTGHVRVSLHWRTSDVDDESGTLLRTTLEMFH